MRCRLGRRIRWCGHRRGYWNGSHLLSNAYSRRARPNLGDLSNRWNSGSRPYRKFHYNGSYKNDLSRNSGPPSYSKNLSFRSCSRSYHGWRGYRY